VLRRRPPARRLGSRCAEVEDRREAVAHPAGGVAARLAGGKRSAAEQRRLAMAMGNNGDEKISWLLASTLKQRIRAAGGRARGRRCRSTQCRRSSTVAACGAAVRTPRRAVGTGHDACWRNLAGGPGPLSLFPYSLFFHFNSNAPTLQIQNISPKIFKLGMIADNFKWIFFIFGSTSKSLWILNIKFRSKSNSNLV
jgi:hypothetical protein